MRSVLYRHFDRDGTLLYVGISLNVIARLIGHRDTSRWFDQIAIIKIQKCMDMETAKRVERRAIISEKPLFNVSHLKIRSGRRTASISKSVQAYIGKIINKYGGVRAAATHTGIDASLLCRFRNGKLSPSDKMLRKLGITKRVSYRTIEHTNEDAL